MASLVTAARAAPQAMLAACAKGLQKGHGDLCGGSKHFALHGLVAGAGPAVAAEGVLHEAQQGAAAEQPCLLEQVLEPREDLQQWLADTLHQIPEQGACRSRTGCHCLPCSIPTLHSRGCRAVDSGGTAVQGGRILRLGSCVSACCACWHPSVLWLSRLLRPPLSCPIALS